VNNNFGSVNNGMVMNGGMNGTANNGMMMNGMNNG